MTMHQIVFFKCKVRLNRTFLIHYFILIFLVLHTVGASSTSEINDEKLDNLEDCYSGNCDSMKSYETEDEGKSFKMHFRYVQLILNQFF